MRPAGGKCPWSTNKITVVVMAPNIDHFGQHFFIGFLGHFGQHFFGDPFGQHFMIV